MRSVLLSAYKEISNPFFWKTIALIKELKSKGMDIELIVGATTGSNETLEKLNGHDVRTIIIHTSKRAGRYNAALEASSASDNDWVLLNHPRSLLQKEAFQSLLAVTNSVQWGAFTHVFDLDHPLLKFTSWWSNHVRGDIKNIFYLDHCLFIRRNIFEKAGGFPSIDIFEDTSLSLRLAQIKAPLRLPWKSTTSSIRFTTNGVWKQAYKNQLLKINFMMGKDHGKMNEIFEKGISLNCRMEESSHLL